MSGPGWIRKVLLNLGATPMGRRVSGSVDPHEGGFLERSICHESSLMLKIHGKKQLITYHKLCIVIVYFT
jgi:hypothetical protein